MPDQPNPSSPVPAGPTRHPPSWTWLLVATWLILVATVMTLSSSAGPALCRAFR